MNSETSNQEAQKRVLDVLDSIQPKSWKGTEDKYSVVLVQEARNARANQINNTKKCRIAVFEFDKL